MKRRKVLKGLSLLGTGLLLNTALPNFSMMKNGQSMIGIGSIAADCMTYLYDKGIVSKYLVVSDNFTIESFKHLYPGFHYINIDDLSDNMEQLLYRLASGNLLFSIKNQEIILFAHFSCEAEYTITKKILQQISELGVPHTIVHFTPFNFEGIMKRELSNEFLAEHRTHDIITIHLQDAVKKYGSFAFNEALTKIYFSAYCSILD